MTRKTPHVLGIDDAPFDKWEDDTVPLVGVVMEGAMLVEGVTVREFPVDGAEATEFLAEWVTDLKWQPTLDAIVLGGITIAGLGIVDLQELAERTRLPTLAVTRHDTGDSDLDRALRAAGLQDRLAILERVPPARQVTEGLYVASVGADPSRIDHFVQSTQNKALMPEPLRVAHLIGAGWVEGVSRGKV